MPASLVRMLVTNTWLCMSILTVKHSMLPKDQLFGQAFTQISVKGYYSIQPKQRSQPPHIFCPAIILTF